MIYLCDHGLKYTTYMFMLISCTLEFTSQIASGVKPSLEDPFLYKVLSTSIGFTFLLAMPNLLGNAQKVGKLILFLNESLG